MSREPKYPINTDFFETWSHPMAYILGFIMADGCVFYNHGSLSLQLSIAIKDSGVVCYIRDQLSPTRPIQCIDRYSPKISEEPQKKYGACILKMTSNALCNSLAQYHIIPRKTGKEVLPEIPEQYKSAFLRGLFDGDGSIGQYQDKRTKNTFRHTFRISMSSQSMPFLEDVNTQLLQNVGRVRLRTDGCGSRLSVTKAADIIKIGQFMYATPGYYLKRKKTNL